MARRNWQISVRFGPRVAHIVAWIVTTNSWWVTTKDFCLIMIYCIELTLKLQYWIGPIMQKTANHDFKLKLGRHRQCPEHADAAIDDRGIPFGKLIQLSTITRYFRQFNELNGHGPWHSFSSSYMQLPRGKDWQRSFYILALWDCNHENILSLSSWWWW